MERISLARLNYGENDMNTHASNDVYVWNFILFLYKFSGPTQTVGDTETGIFFCLHKKHHAGKLSPSPMLFLREGLVVMARSSLVRWTKL
jgi:hypothetical protein